MNDVVGASQGGKSSGTEQSMSIRNDADDHTL
jgi:hypothetical protein